MSIEKEAKKKGYLVRMCEYLLYKRLPTLHKYCVICDQLHLFSSSMIVPTVCSRDLCLWSYQELGVRLGTSFSPLLFKKMFILLFILFYILFYFIFIFIFSFKLKEVQIIILIDKIPKLII